MCQALGRVPIQLKEEKTQRKRKNKIGLLNGVYRQFLAGFGPKFKLIKSEYDSVFRLWGVTLGCVLTPP